MSFILDALRKSESERQRNQRPGMAPLPAGSTRKGPGWWVALVALLIGVNLSLLLVMWIMSDRQVVPPAAAPATPPPPELTPGVQPPATPPAATPAPVPAPTSSAANPAPPVAADTAATDGELPTYEELILQNALSLPPLNMDIHVYSDKPAERFVFINMSRYNEGQTLSEGPLLVEVTPSGVVLRYQGYDFLVTRQQ